MYNTGTKSSHGEPILGREGMDNQVTIIGGHPNGPIAETIRAIVWQKFLDRECLARNVFNEVLQKETPVFTAARCSGGHVVSMLRCDFRYL